MRATQKVFRTRGVSRLLSNLEEPSGIDAYLDPAFSVIEDETLSFHFESHGISPALDAKKSDYENARLLFEYYKHLTPLQASDARLWTFLTHATHRSYVQERWPLAPDISENSDTERIAAASRYINEKWFTSNSARSLRRNSLAGLWWPVYLSVMPAEGWNDKFRFLHSSDEYHYSRMLLTNADLQLNLLDRKAGWSRNVLLPVLAVLEHKSELLGSRDLYRPFIREINLMMSYRKLGSMPPQRVFETIRALAEEML